MRAGKLIERPHDEREPAGWRDGNKVPDIGVKKAKQVGIQSKVRLQDGWGTD